MVFAERKFFYHSYPLRDQLSVAHWKALGKSSSFRLCTKYLMHYSVYKLGLAIRTFTREAYHYPRWLW